MCSLEAARAPASTVLVSPCTRTRVLALLHENRLHVGHDPARLLGVRRGAYVQAVTGCRKLELLEEDAVHLMISGRVPGIIAMVMDDLASNEYW